MLRSSKDLENYDVQTRDGKIGRMKSILFNERTMRIRYLHLDTRKWLPGKDVVISPEMIETPIESPARMDLDMTMDELRSSPSVEEHKPVSEEKKDNIFGGMPPKVFFMPYNIEPSITMMDNEDMVPGGKKEKTTLLRSSKKVEGYTVHATDGNLGDLEEFIVDTDDWLIRYLIIDTRRFLPGKKVIISPDWVKGFDWDAREVVVDHTMDEIKGAPQYDPTAPVNRVYEKSLYDYYGRPYYWK